MITEQEKENTEKESSNTKEESVFQLTEEDMAFVGECRERYNSICGKFPPNFGKALSRRERDQKELFMPYLVYSEISFDALAISILKIVKKYGKFSQYGTLPSVGGVFFDLGSGTGKTLVAASLVSNFSSCNGIEMLEALHRGAEWVLEAYVAQKAELTKVYGKLPVMSSTEGNFLNVQQCDWRKADLLFVNASCYGEEILNDLMKLSTEMKKGAFVISVTNAIPGKDFVMCEYTEQEMNWGLANVFIQQKTTEPHEYVEPVEEDEEEEEKGEEQLLDDSKVELVKSAVSALFGS